MLHDNSLSKNDLFAQKILQQHHGGYVDGVPTCRLFPVLQGNILASQPPMRRVSQSIDVVAQFLEFEKRGSALYSVGGQDVVRAGFGVSVWDRHVWFGEGAGGR